jgi:hypothetical protein
MASATSKPAQVSIYKGNAQQRRSGKGSRDVNHYKTKVTTLGDGSIKRETFRTDAKGNNSVKVQEATVKDGKETSNTVSSNATAAERKALNSPNSQLRNSIRTQTDDANKTRIKNEADAAAGGLTDAGKKNQEILGGGSGNNANDEGEAGDTSRPSSEPPKNEAGTRDDFGAALHYPVSRDPKQDRIKFDMLKYEPKKISGFKFDDTNSNRKSIGTVTLPIPGGISDSNACNWGDDTMGPLQLAAAGAALEMLTPDGSTQLGGVLGNLKSQLYTNNTEMKQLIQAKFSAAAVGADANSLFSRTQGMILNPNLELLFQSPTLRPFTFQFKMSPRSAAEAKVITQIIRFFKQGMAPIREESRLFLKTPHTFRIKYVQMGDNDKSIYLNKFKECALLSCSVQYTPEGNYAPYEDGAMSSYQMSLQFKELEPVYNDSYKDMPTDAIGF